MPQIFKVGSYCVYFWSKEGLPLEPVHVHISIGAPQENATKVWLTKKGKTLLANNKSQIKDNELNAVMRIIETRYFSIVEKWRERFGEVSFYC